MKTTRFYVVNCEKAEDSCKEMSKDKFIATAEHQGTVYSGDEFIKAFDNCEINTNTDSVRMYVVDNFTLCTVCGWTGDESELETVFGNPADEEVCPDCGAHEELEDFYHE